MGNAEGNRRQVEEEKNKDFSKLSKMNISNVYQTTENLKLDFGPSLITQIAFGNLWSEIMLNTLLMPMLNWKRVQKIVEELWQSKEDEKEFWIEGEETFLFNISFVSSNVAIHMVAKEAKAIREALRLKEFEGILHTYF
ncbi:hypothetical protein ACJX0J_024978 [Zea mays]